LFFRPKDLFSWPLKILLQYRKNRKSLQQENNDCGGVFSGRPVISAPARLRRPGRSGAAPQGRK
jgi:hypothetical protein